MNAGMSAIDPKRTSESYRRMSAFGNSGHLSPNNAEGNDCFEPYLRLLSRRGMILRLPRVPSAGS